MLTQLLGLGPQQVLDESIQDMAGLGLARMHPSSENDGTLLTMELDEVEQALVEALEVVGHLIQLLLCLLIKLVDLRLDNLLQQLLAFSVHLPTVLDELED